MRSMRSISMKKDDHPPVLLISLARKGNIKGSSNRAFGVVVGGMLLLFGCWPLLTGAVPRWYLIGPAALLVMAGLIAPVVLAPLNRAWIKLGLLLRRNVA